MIELGFWLSLCYGDTLEAIEQDLGARARAPNAEEGNAQVDAECEVVEPVSLPLNVTTVSLRLGCKEGIVEGLNWVLLALILVMKAIYRDGDGDGDGVKK